ncbi:MAG: hypothetical protein LBT38_03310 [Deltaproteobacteria bacterium]|jgi:hypothetical protein|nr:hypothetical protein [Deltaproteobacteria bacterium]
MPKLKFLNKALVARGLILALTFAFSFWALAGCVLTMPKPLLSGQKTKGIPDLVGRYLDDKGGEIRILSRDNLSDNTFTVFPPSKKSPLSLTIQPLDGQRYVVQAQPEGSLGVFLSVADIDLPRITLYVFPKSGDAVRELAKRCQVTVNKDGLITEYKSAQGVIRLFMGLYGLEKETLVFIKQPK